MKIRVTDGGGRFKTADFTVNIRQDAAPPVFTKFPPDDFKILENLTDDTIIYRIKVYVNVITFLHAVLLDLFFVTFNKLNNKSWHPNK